MIERINILYGFLKNRECIKAKEMIDYIYGKLSIKSYAESYTIVLFVETLFENLSLLFVKKRRTSVTTR